MYHASSASISSEMTILRGKKGDRMSMTELNQGKLTLTRRGFLKATGVTAGAATLLYSGQPVLKALAVDYNSGQPENPGEVVKQCICRPNCFGACRINVHVRDGNVVKTSMAPMLDERYNRICLRGLSHVQRIYSEKRIKYPMKRAGERGEGKWERISWDEAIETIATKFKEIQKKYGKQAVGFWPSSGNLGSINGGGGTPGMMLMLNNVMEASYIQNSVDMAHGTGQKRVVGGNISHGLEDLPNSKNIVCWSYNCTEATIHTWHLLREAQEEGAKLVVIDPTFTQLASKADTWISIRPGTDPALCLGMMHIYYEEDLIDRDFLINHSNSPFLVKDADGLLLRRSDLGIAAEEGPLDSSGKATVIDPYVVWDEAKGAGIVVGEATKPALEGSFTVNGMPCKTAFTLLKTAFEKYTPEYTEKITEIPAETIIEFARLCASGPTAHMQGYGSGAYSNGVQVGQTLNIMAAMTGNLGKAGAQVGTHWKFFPGFNYVPTMPDKKMGPTVSNLALPQILETGKLKGKDFPIKALWTFVGNPLCCTNDTKLFREKVWPQLEFVVHSDQVFNDTTDYADIVLPIPHYFEFDEVHASGEHGFIFWTEKSHDPLFESKTDSQIARLVGEAMGLEKYFTMTDDEYLASLLDSKYCTKLGITLETLKKEKIMRDGTNPLIPADGYKFPTDSGRAEIYCEKPKVRLDQGQKFDTQKERLPYFEPPHEAWSDNELAKTYPLILMSERPRFRVHSQWHETPWLRELEPEPIVKINPGDAQARNIKAGDYVEAFNARGSTVAKAVISSAIRPGTLVYPKGWQVYQHKVGCWSDLGTAYYDPVGVNGNFMDVLCEIKLWKGGR